MGLGKSESHHVLYLYASQRSLSVVCGPWDNHVMSQRSLSVVCGPWDNNVTSYHGHI